MTSNRWEQKSARFSNFDLFHLVYNPHIIPLRNVKSVQETERYSNIQRQKHFSPQHSPKLFKPATLSRLTPFFTDNKTLTRLLQET